jgi:hypothetical protein
MDAREITNYVRELLPPDGPISPESICVVIKDGDVGLARTVVSQDLSLTGELYLDYKVDVLALVLPGLIRDTHSTLLLYLPRSLGL